MSAPRKLPADYYLLKLLPEYRITEIARWFDVNPRSVREHARRLGFAPRKPGGPTRRMHDRPCPINLAA